MNWVKVLGPLVIAVISAYGGTTYGYAERDEDFQRVVAKYKDVKHQLALCVAGEGEYARQ